MRLRPDRRLFALEHYGIAADIIVTAKSLGAGMPVSAITGQADIWDATHPGGMGGTYGGNPVTCVAAIAAIEMIRQPSFLAAPSAWTIGSRHAGRVEGAASVIGDVRGLGIDDGDRARQGSGERATGGG